LQEAAYYDIHNFTKWDATFMSKGKAYMKWVDAERAAGHLVAGAYYLTSENIDCYFLAVVVNMTAGQAMVCKEVSCLQWFATNHEHIGADRFEVENETVLLCLKTQIANRAKKLEEKSNGSDPNKGLKDVLPEFEREILMRHVYGNGTSSTADAAMMNFLFHLGSVKRRDFHSIKTLLSISASMIEGVTKAVVGDFATYQYIFPGLMELTDA
jgi:hypothetical protein